MSELRLKRFEEKLERRQKELSGFVEEYGTLQQLYKDEINRCKTALIALEEENSKLKQSNTELAEKVETLEAKLASMPKSFSNREYNQLNIKLNECMSKLAEVKAGNRDSQSQRSTARTPLKAIKQEKNQLTVDTFLRNAAKLEDPINVFDVMSSSQKSSNAEEGAENDEVPALQSQWSTSNEFDDKYDQTYDARKYTNRDDDSIDLRAGNVELSSSPVKSDSFDNDRFAISKVKQESIKKDYIEIKDSFELSDDDYVKLEEEEEDIKVSYPTPSTTSKAFKTPALKVKRSLILNTPSEETPSKKSKPLVKPMQTITDLTINTKKNREWIIEDFKINPALNNNEEKAYQVTLRDKSARSCVHGKTCLNCEKFYRALEAIPNYELLGPQWNGASWKEASKNFQIVSKTSRHRELWDRPESAPGFGDFEFPSTQRLKENRALADLRNKRKAYERLYSALHDRRFLFKDDDYNNLVESKNFTVDDEIFFKYLERSDVK